MEVVERAGGQSELAAHLLPITINGLALCASLVMLFAARYSLPVPRIARVGVIMGIGATISANLLHGIAHGFLAAIIAMRPALALVVSYELVTWIVSASRSLERRSIVVVEHEQEANPDLDRVVELLVRTPTLSAAALGRSLGLPYQHALDLMKQARAVIKVVL